MEAWRGEEKTEEQAIHHAFYPSNSLVGFKVVFKMVFKVVLGALTLLREVRGDSRLGSPPVRTGALILPGGRQERNRK